MRRDFLALPPIREHNPSATNFRVVPPNALCAHLAMLAHGAFLRTDHFLRNTLERIERDEDGNDVKFQDLKCRILLLLADLKREETDGGEKCA